MSFELKDDDIIFMMRSGSHAYGTNIETSDEDFRGVALLTDPAYYFGFLKRFEQKDKGFKEDKVIYDIRKAVKLMADANPNMLELLFCREEDIRKMAPEWQVFRDNRDLFLSTKVKFTYSGYAYSQLKRIKRHRVWLVNPPTHQPTREEFGLPEDKLVSSDQLGAFQWLLARFLQDSVEWFRLSESTREELTGINFIGMVQSGMPDDTLEVVKEAVDASDNFMNIVARETKYRKAKKEWKSYQKWKKSRNPERFEMEKKFGYDCKHAMHLVRLLRTGYEILTTGEVHVYRPDAEELVAIRRGAWTYDELVEYADEMDEKMTKGYDESELPRTADRNKIDDLLCQTIDTALATSQGIRV